MDYPDGESYNGEWKDDRRHGIGLLKIKGVMKECRGKWFDGERICWID
jgi:hypothetical protein